MRLMHYSVDAGETTRCGRHVALDGRPPRSTSEHSAVTCTVCSRLLGIPPKDFVSFEVDRGTVNDAYHLLQSLAVRNANLRRALERLCTKDITRLMASLRVVEDHLDPDSRGDGT